MTMLTTAQLFRALDVEVLPAPSSTWKNPHADKNDRILGPVIGDPNDGAQARWCDMRKQAVVYWFPRIIPWHLAAPIAGPADLHTDEDATIVIETLASRCLEAAPRLLCRAALASYGFAWDNASGDGYDNVGYDDLFFASDVWNQACQDAYKRGVVALHYGRYVPVFGIGPYPKWAEYILSEKEIGRA